MAVTSPSAAAVWLPNVVPPRAASLQRVAGGDRRITLAWASNREPDLQEYRVYRAGSEQEISLATVRASVPPDAARDAEARRPSTCGSSSRPQLPNSSGTE